MLYAKKIIIYYIIKWAHSLQIKNKNFYISLEIYAYVYKCISWILKDETYNYQFKNKHFISARIKYVISKRIQLKNYTYT